MISVTHFAATAPDFGERARATLAALAARPGYLRGTLARSTDSDDAWLLVTEWENVGSYRRALGAYEVKLQTPVLGAAMDLPTAFEPIVEIAPGGAARTHDSDLA